MKILIEGIDKSGKSSIVKELQKLFPSAVTFKNKLKPVVEDDSARTSGIYLGAYQMANCLDKITLFDRSHLTEIVYARKRCYDAEVFFNWPEYEKSMLKDTLLIYMSAPVEIIKTRFKKDNETYLSESEIDWILDGYERYLSKTNLKFIRLDSTTEMTKNLAEVVQALAFYKIYKHL